MEHLIAFPILDPHRESLRRLMDDAAEVTGLSPPYLRLPPHVSARRPFSGVDEQALVRAISLEVARAHQTRMTLAGSLFSFGTHYIVCPVQTTLWAASLWAGILTRVAGLHGYTDGDNEYEGDNTLHVTVAAKTSRVFDTVWPVLKSVYVRPMTIPLRQVVLYRKLGSGSQKQNWKKAATFAIPR